MPGDRMRRVNEVLREVLAEGVEALGDPGLGFVTVTSVRAAPDVSKASVYVSVLGSERRRARSLRALERAHGVLQSRIARELHLKRTPQLSFHYDETLDQAMRLEELMSREQDAPVEPQPGMTDIALDTDLEAVVAALAAADRVLIATHENPDGDAIGSMTAAAAALRQLGRDVRTYLEPESTIPHEVAFLDTERRRAAHRSGHARGVGAARARLRQRASPRRPVHRFARALRARHRRRPSPRQQPLRRREPDRRACLVDRRDPGAASSTGWASSSPPPIAEALYVGLVTDTGRFQYRTTSPAALRLGARLVEAGVDVHKVFERVFESVQPGKLKLLGRVIDHAVSYCDGRLLVSHVSRDDLALVEGDEATTEGLIDHLRAVEGVQVAGLIREQVPLADGSLAPNRVSLRSRGLIDVSAIARLSCRRRPQAGRGLLARRAASTTSAGSSCPRSAPSWPSRPRSGPPDARDHRPVPGRQAFGTILVRGPARAAPGARPQAWPRRHARPVCDRPAAGRRRPGDAPGHLPLGRRQGLRRGRAVRGGLDHARPRGRDHAGRARRRCGRGAGRGRDACAARSSRRCPPPRRSRSTASAPTCACAAARPSRRRRAT